MLRQIVCIFIVSSLTATPITAQSKAPLKVSFVRAGNEFKAQGVNNLPYPITVKYIFKLANLKCSKGESFTMTMPAGKKIAVADFSIIEPTSKYKVTFEYRWQPGAYRAKHDKKYNYALPFAAGKAHEVVQGYFGTISHKKGGPNQYALDFEMPIGTPVHAARAGIVFKTEDRFTENGKTEEFRDKANHIFIMHDDGTYAAYLHLKPKGVAVKVGDKVQRGQLIGYSGQTGWATGPHLHFDVRRAVNADKVETIPVPFTTSDGKRAFLREGITYRNPKEPRTKSQPRTKNNN